MSVEIANATLLRECQRDLADVAGVVTTDLLDADESHTDGPLLEVVIAEGYARVPPRVLRTIAECDCGVRTARPQGSGASHRIVEVV